MKKLFLLTIVSALFSCSQITEEEKIISQVEEKVKNEIIPKLKDPKSFEKNEIILDTLTKKEYLKEIMKDNTNRILFLIDMSKIISSKEYDTEILLLNKTNDSLKRVFEQTSDTSIMGINIDYSYRSKNGFGALDIYHAKLWYIPSQGRLVWEK